MHIIHRSLHHMKVQKVHLVVLVSQPSHFTLRLTRVILDKLIVTLLDLQNTTDLFLCSQTNITGPYPDPAHIFTPHFLRIPFNINPPNYVCVSHVVSSLQVFWHRCCISHHPNPCYISGVVTTQLVHVSGAACAKFLQKYNIQVVYTNGILNDFPHKGDS